MYFDLRRRQILAAYKPFGIPPEYMPMAALNTSGGGSKRWIDLNLRFSLNYKYKVKFRVFNSTVSSSQTRCIFGGGYSKTEGNHGLWWRLDNANGAGAISFTFGKGQTGYETGYKSVSNLYQWHEAVVDCSTAKLYLDGTEMGGITATLTDSDTTPSRTYTTALGGLYRTTSSTVNIASYSTYTFIGLFQVYDNGVLIRDLVPVSRKEDGRPGMYDRAGSISPSTGTPFYTHEGSALFECRRRDTVSDDYRRVKYLECPGQTSSGVWIGSLNPADTMEIELDYWYPQQSGGALFGFGSTTSANVGFMFNPFAGRNRSQARIADQTYDIPASFEGRHRVRIGAAGIFVDGALVQEVGQHTWAAYDQNFYKSVRCFGVNSADNDGYLFSPEGTRIYSVIYRYTDFQPTSSDVSAVNGRDVKVMLPVVRKSDNASGLYDTLESVSNGAFKLGYDINPGVR